MKIPNEKFDYDNMKQEDSPAYMLISNRRDRLHELWEFSGMGMDGPEYIKIRIWTNGKENEDFRKFFEYISHPFSMWQLLEVSYRWSKVTFLNEDEIEGELFIDFL